MSSKMIKNIQDVRNGSISVIDILEERINVLRLENPKVNAVVDFNLQLLKEQVTELNEKIKSGFKGELCGAVFTIKDNLEVEGLHATAGMKKFQDKIIESDCAIVKKLREKGAIILGKTNMPPAAMDMQTNNDVYGRTNHPIYYERTCGGSSGGGACAVSLGISDIDVGNDFMGSIRVPSHFCGVYGFVPTDHSIGKVKIVGGKRLGSTMSNILRLGLQASNCEDLIYVYNLLSEDGLISENKTGQGKIRVAYTKDAGGIPISKDYEATFLNYIEKLKKDYEIYEMKKEDFNFDLARESFLKLIYAHIAVELPPIMRFIARYFGKKELINAELMNYIEAEEVREDCIADLESFFCRNDVILSPVSSTVAFEHRKPIKLRGTQPIYSDFDIDGKKVPYSVATMGFTTPFSLTASPVFTIPIGKDKSGLPAGVQVVGRRHAEKKLFHIIEELKNYQK